MTNNHFSFRCVVLGVALLFVSLIGAEETKKGDVSAFTKQIEEFYRKKLKSFGEPAELGEQALSRRGDAYFFLGNFKEAVADYEAMCKIDPELSKSHWRRGIAFYYAGDFPKAAKQFEEYHSFDNIDRENGIWRYFSQVRAYGVKRARQDLLKYEKDDREPFPHLYKLFAGEVEPKDVLSKIDESKVTGQELEKRLFYAHLYIGLHYAVQGENEKAVPHLVKSVQNKWGPQAGYGPHYMWQVGRLQLNELLKLKKDKQTK